MRAVRVAVIGTGVIGRSWAKVFTRAGSDVQAWDPQPAALSAAIAWHAREAAHDTAARGPERATPAGRLTPMATLRDAVAAVDYVQESGPETLAAKRAIFAELDRAAPPLAVLASSTSALDMSAIAEGLTGARRCIVAHPVNPPHVVPAVEVLGGSGTSSETVERTVGILGAVGQSPVVLARYVPGFLVNRLQMALVREALSLLAQGVATADAIDAVIRDGLGLRWALLGPFGVANTNADGGVREYLTRYRPSIEMLMRDLGECPPLDASFIEQIGAATDAMEAGASRAGVREWRDRLVSRIVALKHSDPHPAHDVDQTTDQDAR
jgi:3-hydroxyacyl-CoA dehydrogenase